MKMQINKFARLTGVSVRTLHYYDEIGLLKPCAVDEQNGYRFYDEQSLLRMQEILFYRELDFSLKEICNIISCPNYDKYHAMKEQKNLLILKKERLERLISALDGAMKGEQISMKTFDDSEIQEQRKLYAKEAKEKWGGTTAYQESDNKTKHYTDEKWSEVNTKMDSLILQFAECKKNGVLCDSEQAQELVRQWQSFITETYYDCTKEILAGLAEMYVSDPRFMENLDRYGEGTADYMSHAILIYC